MQKCIAFILYCIMALGSKLYAQQSIKVHSHNDYSQPQPFWNAWNNNAASIEADVFLQDGKLLVAHNIEDLPTAKDIEAMYLQPLGAALQKEKNHRDVCLLIDLKTGGNTLDALAPLLQKFETANRKSLKKHLVTFVISGNRPSPKDYTKYAPYIMFDQQEIWQLPPSQADKVFMLSFSFDKFSNWDGTGALPEKDGAALKAIIKLAHEMKKPIRFWATPDTPAAWGLLYRLGVDYINTDHPKEAYNYLSKMLK